MAGPRAFAWRLPILALGGLLVALAVVGIAGIVINRGITDQVQQAVQYDVELEDNADDLRVAILDVRNSHRDLLFNDPAPQRIEAWEARYSEMQAQIDELDALYRSGLRTDGLPSTAELRELAEAYYADFRPAIDAYDATRPVDFQLAAEANLWRLDELQRHAERLDKAGEERAAAAFLAIDAAVGTGTLVLVGVVVGLGLVGLALAASSVTMIRQQRRLVVAQAAAAAEQAAASRARNDFIADASHELRTPLTVLRGNAEIGLALEADCEHAEGTREALREIVAESARMARLVDDLLFLARSDATGVPLEFRPVDADELLKTIAGRAAVLARQRGAELRSQVEAEGMLTADAARVEQAVLVLVENAARYSLPGEAIELRVRRDAQCLLIEVSDCGPGIPERDRARIFERFYRGDGRGPRGRGGAGLGLAIARTIVDGHGGRIAAIAGENGGTTVQIWLPFASRPEAQRATWAAPAPRGDSS